MKLKTTLFQRTYWSRLSSEENPWAVQRRITSTFELDARPTQTLRDWRDNESWADVAEEVFHITNAPEELLSEDQKALSEIHHKNRASSLSVGDVVQVTHQHGTEFFLCQSSGWKKANAVELWQFFENVIIIIP